MKLTHYQKDHSLDAALKELFRVEQMVRESNDDPDVWVALPKWAFVQVADLVNQHLNSHPQN